MYYREHVTNGNASNLPEHYSGCAFSPTASETPEPVFGIDVAKPSIAPKSRSNQTPDRRLPFNPPETDAVLIFGLMLLLSGSEKQEDLTSILSLLLFCG